MPLGCKQHRAEWSSLDRPWAGEGANSSGTRLGRSLEVATGHHSLPCLLAALCERIACSERKPALNSSEEKNRSFLFHKNTLSPQIEAFASPGKEAILLLQSNQWEREGKFHLALEKSPKSHLSFGSDCHATTIKKKKLAWSCSLVANLGS